MKKRVSRQTAEARGGRPRSKVCIIQPVLKKYRVPFFKLLRDELDAVGIELEVVYGEPWKGEAEKGDHGHLPPPLGRSVPSRLLLGRLLVQQPTRSFFESDLVIIEHAAKHVSLWLLLANRFIRGKRLAFWGHALNQHHGGSVIARAIRHHVATAVDWWFTYTPAGASYIQQIGFPADRVTPVFNSIDTSAFRSAVASSRQARCSHSLAAFGLNETDRVILFCGSLYPAKRLDLLLDAMKIVGSVSPNARLLVGGAGQQWEDVSAKRGLASNVRYLGPLHGKLKSDVFALADFVVIPGAVGLGVLDAFAAGLPLIATTAGGHGPEIDYLAGGHNGLVSAASAESLAADMLKLLNDNSLLQSMKQAALKSSYEFSVERMAKRFAEGIVHCLDRS